MVFGDDLVSLGDADKSLYFETIQNSQNVSNGEHSATVTARLSSQNFYASNKYNGAVVCYRRNQFQINGSIFIKDTSQVTATTTVTASLVARESMFDNPVTLISVPKGKLDTNVHPPVNAVCPITAPIETLEGSVAPIAISWPRLQFRTSTAKGGRKNQHFRIEVHITATLENGIELSLARVQSPPIIVVGRSPGCYGVSKKGRRRAASKHSNDTNTANDVLRHETPAMSPPFSHQSATSAGGSLTGIHPASPSAYFGYDSQVLDAPSWSFHTGSGLTPLSLNLEDGVLWNMPLPEEVDGTLLSPHSSSDQSHSASEEPATPPLADDEFEITDIRLDNNTVSADPEESFSYKYIPLALDDRTPAVQAIYQPHGEHHKLALPKTLRPGRYFGD